MLQSNDDDDTLMYENDVPITGLWRAIYELKQRVEGLENEVNTLRRAMGLSTHYFGDK